jgi:hypothetical protein
MAGVGMEISVAVDHSLHRCAALPILVPAYPCHPFHPWFTESKDRGYCPGQAKLRRTAAERTGS